jgi:hypothetical protein
MKVATWLLLKQHYSFCTKSTAKVSRVSLNVYPMWLLLTYTRPRERYGRICQYKKVDPIFSNYLFCFSEFGDKGYSIEKAFERPLKAFSMLYPLSPNSS